MGSSTGTFIALYLNVVPTILLKRHTQWTVAKLVQASRRGRQAEAIRCRRVQAGEVLRLTSRARPLRAAGP
jgi:hypothetical protein